MAKKWIIYDNKLRISSSVEFHVELLPDNYDKNKIGGGGRWEVLNKDLYGVDPIIFYGSSVDFFQATTEAFQQAYDNTILPLALSEHKPFFTTKEWFNDALKEFIDKQNNDYGHNN